MTDLKSQKYIYRIANQYADTFIKPCHWPPLRKSAVCIKMAEHKYASIGIPLSKIKYKGPQCYAINCNNHRNAYSKARGSTFRLKVVTYIFQFDLKGKRKTKSRFNELSVQTFLKFIIVIKCQFNHRCSQHHRETRSVLIYMVLF